MISYLGENIRKLGFGLMRLPMKGTDVDIEQTKKMVDLFMEKGFTYFDTAYGYINGKSEEVAKKVLVDRYPRESFQLATKLPAWEANTMQEAREMFWTSLRRTGVDYFDFYLLHNLGDNRIRFFNDFGIWDFLEKQREKGLINHLGFSFHDKAVVLEKILKEHPEIEFVQLQINYGDWESEAIESRKCYEIARKHNKPIIIMEPVKGGSLATLSGNLGNLLKEVNKKASLSSWAIRYAASLDGLITVLSGMSTLDQMKDNVSYMEDFYPLSPREREVIEKVQKGLKLVPNIPCTDCQYCMKDCPQNIMISKIFGAMNIYLVYSNLPGAKGSYAWETKDSGVASKCIECGQCESICPQHIHIMDELKRVAEVLETL